MKVQDILTDESKWCQGPYAKTIDGYPVSSMSVAAHSFCFVGAVSRAYRKSPRKRSYAYQKAMRHLGKCPEAWNDTQGRTFAEVRGLIEELDL